VAETQTENSVCHRIWSLDMQRLTNLIIILLPSDRRVKRHIIVWEVALRYYQLIPITTIEKIDDTSFERKRQSHLGSFLTIPNAFKKYFLSNSDTAYTVELYSDFSIKQVKTSRAINCKASESAGLYQGTGLHGDIV
jgi:hypothetical protein